MNRNNIMVVAVSLLLFLMPFFWFKPGELDLGGDSNRLYFYDPINFLKNTTLYGILPFGAGEVTPSFFLIPHVAFILFVSTILHSAYLTTLVFHSIKIVFSFLFIYAIVRELIDRSSDSKSFFSSREVASVLAGLFYIFTLGIMGGWETALITQDQVYINPLMFYLLLRFMICNDFRYLWIALTVTLLFAQNFSYTGAPPFFAFYPLAILFVVFYVMYIRKKRISWKKVGFGMIIFLGVHAFHFIPELMHIFSSGSNINMRVFDKNDISQELQYFLVILPVSKVSLHLIAYSPKMIFGYTSVIYPIIMIAGFWLCKNKHKTMLLTAIFFLITLFFVTGSITGLGVSLYKLFFLIPGFAMFRNFYGQWQYAFFFFYALLFGQALYVFMNWLKGVYRIFVSIFLLLFIVINAWYFIKGDAVRTIGFPTNDVHLGIQMDPRYEEMLAYIRSLPIDGKILTLPFSDSIAQVLHDSDKGAYIGVSTLSQLTNKKDFAGYQAMYPYSDLFWRLSQKKDFDSVNRLLGILNIRYIFYNSSPLIYDTTFPEYPYSHDYVRKYLPENQADYKIYVPNLTEKKLYSLDSYSVYLSNQKYFLPHFYIPINIEVYKDDPTYIKYEKARLFFQIRQDQKYEDPRVAYADIDSCKQIFKENCAKGSEITSSNIPSITFQQINPTKYKVFINNAKEPYLLVFSDAFNSSWEAYFLPVSQEPTNIVANYFNGDIKEESHKNIFIDRETMETLFLKKIPKNRHISVNGYANGWYIHPEDIEGKDKYKLIIELKDQKIFLISGLCSLFFIGFMVIWGIRLFYFSQKSK